MDAGGSSRPTRQAKSSSPMRRWRQARHNRVVRRLLFLLLLVIGAFRRGCHRPQTPPTAVVPSPSTPAPESLAAEEWEKRADVFARSYDEVLAALKHQDDKLNRTLTALAFLTAGG